MATLDDISPYEIERKVFDWCIRNYGYYGSVPYWIEVLGEDTIFRKLAHEVWKSSEVICPHCGKKGYLRSKTTIVKRKYRYNKLYVYHEKVFSSLPKNRRMQKWCYLNKNDLESPNIKEAIIRWSHASNVRKWFYKSLKLPK